jgi:hypothetical protein
MQSIQFKELSDQRKFGVELEVSNDTSKQGIASILRKFYRKCGVTRPVRVTPQVKGWAETHNNDYWHVKYDSTCGPLGKYKDHGWELASFIGHSPGDIEEIGFIAKTLAGAGIKTNLNCGLHIHVDVADFTQMQMGVLLARWLKVEETLFNICDPIRKRSPYCKTLRHSDLLDANYTPSLPDHFWQFMAPTNLSSHENEDKKYTLNTVGYAYGLIKSSHSRKTVELRMPECLLEYDHVVNWTRLYLNFVENCKTANAPEDLSPADNLDDVLHYLGLFDKHKFSIFDDDLHQVRVWFLTKLVRANTHFEANKRLDFISQI